MPKRVGYLYEKMCDKEKIKEAILKSAKGKVRRHDVQKVLNSIDKYVDRTYDLLVSNSFVPSAPKSKPRYDVTSRKERIIFIVPYWPDAVIHRLMVMVCQDVLLRGMYPWSCAAIPGRGSAKAQAYVERVMHQDPSGTKYVLKMDIHKFYPSINHRKLIWALARKIKDKRFLKLIWNVLETVPSGLPIGYFICQWLANYYLEPLDWYIISLPGVKHYTRYMDDMVVFGSSKKRLHKARMLIMQYLNRMGLELKGNWQVFPLSARPLDFVGYKHYRSHKTCRKATFLRFTRQCRRAQKRIAAGKPISYKMASGLLSRVGILTHCNSLGARQKYYEPIGDKRLKEVVRRESKRRLSATQRIYAGVCTKATG